MIRRKEALVTVDAADGSHHQRIASFRLKSGKHSLLHFRAREATEAAQRAFTARALRMKSEVRGPG